MEACFDGGCDDRLAYTYDNVGNRLTEERPAGTTSYSYDPADRLTATDRPDGQVAYDHDANGNRIVIWYVRETSIQRPGQVDQWARGNILASQVFWWLALVTGGVGLVLLVVAGVMAVVAL